MNGQSNNNNNNGTLTRTGKKLITIETVQTTLTPTRNTDEPDFTKNDDNKQMITNKTIETNDKNEVFVNKIIGNGTITKKQINSNEDIQYKNSNNAKNFNNINSNVTETIETNTVISSNKRILPVRKSMCVQMLLTSMI